MTTKEHKPNLSAIQLVRTYLKTYLTDYSLREWVEKRAPLRSEPFYSSIDLRDAGFKLVPVDANLYPAGFNNICSEDLGRSREILKSLLKRHLGHIPKKVAILPELHTRNPFYADNLYELRQIFRNIDIETEIGWLEDEGSSEKNPITLMTSHHKKITAYPFFREANTLKFEPFTPDFILLNNDFSSGYPEILKKVEQPIEPSPKLGWHSRKKADFFLHYNKLASDLAKTAGLDPWHLQINTELVSSIDFNEGIGIDRIAHVAEKMLHHMVHEYKTRGIEEKPFVFVKNNTGTYGMGILRVENASDLLKLNRRDRNKMAVGKNHMPIKEVLVQEGIPTRFQSEGVAAEPVIYLFGHELMGGFLRKNPKRGRIDNLNSQGMVLQKLCLSDLRREVDRDLELELVYGAIAQLSVAAMTLEIAKIGET